MSDYPMLISNKLHSFRIFVEQRYYFNKYLTFKELFVCKSNNKTGDLEMNLLIFSSHTSFSVKAILSVSTPSPKKILNERVPTAA